MSQNGKSTTCETCKKPMRGFHTLAGVINGNVMAHCHRDGVPDNELPLAEALTFLLDTCVEKTKAQTQVAELTSEKASARHSGKAQGRRDAKAEENGKLEETRAALRGEYDAKLLDLTGQRDDLKNRLEGANEDLVQTKSKLLELEGVAGQLMDAEKVLKTDLAACQRKSLDLQLKVDELTQEQEALTQERDELVYKTSLIPRLENALRKRCREYLYAGRGNLSHSTRIGMLELTVARYEELYGPLPKLPEGTIEELLAAVEDDVPVDPKDVIERAVPKSVPPPPPKAAAVIVPEPVVVPMTPRAPVPVRVSAVVIDDQESDSEAFASADDDDADDDVGDDSIQEEEHEHSDVECTFCDKRATLVMNYTTKDGDADEMPLCDLSTHPHPALLAHLQKVVKDAPKSVKDIPSRFNPIQ